MAALNRAPRRADRAQESFDADSTIRQVLYKSPEGRHLLYEHGYDIGEGFIDGLSQNQSLRTAAWSGRLRDLAGLLEMLNQSS